MCVNFSPLVFAAGLIVGIPYFAKFQAWTQVIEVPVRTAGNIEMVPYAGLQTARAESAADVGIITGFEKEGAEFADFDRSIQRGGENQRICAGKRIHKTKEIALYLSGSKSP